VTDLLLCVFVDSSHWRLMMSFVELQTAESFASLCVGAAKMPVADAIVGAPM